MFGFGVRPADNSSARQAAYASVISRHLGVLADEERGNFDVIVTGTGGGCTAVQVTPMGFENYPHVLITDGNLEAPVTGSPVTAVIFWAEDQDTTDEDILIYEEEVDAHTVAMAVAKALGADLD